VLVSFIFLILISPPAAWWKIYAKLEIVPVTAYTPKPPFLQAMEQFPTR
jgi:hypothetical protein